ncbi:hypothetical protein GH733_006918, partial [Mirounga leonina]
MGQIAMDTQKPPCFWSALQTFDYSSPSGPPSSRGEETGLTVDAAASAARPSAGHGGAPRGRRGSRVAAARARTPAPTSASREGKGSAPPQSCPQRFAAVQRLRATLRGGGRCRALTRRAWRGGLRSAPAPGPPAGRKMAAPSAADSHVPGRCRRAPPPALAQCATPRQAQPRAPGRYWDAAGPGRGQRRGGGAPKATSPRCPPLTRARGSGARSGGNLPGGDLHQVGLLGM